jgi:hypothetical protein
VFGEVVVADFSAFTELFESNNSCLEESLGESIVVVSRGDFSQQVRVASVFQTAPQVGVGLFDTSVEVSLGFEFNVFGHDGKVSAVDLDDVSKASGNGVVFSKSRDVGNINNIELTAFQDHGINFATIVVQKGQFNVSFAVNQNVNSNIGNTGGIG